MLLNDLYYQFIKTKTNITYSIDMLRLKTYISFFEYTELEFYLNTLCKDKIKKFWVSDKVMCFHYNYLIEIEEGKSFYFGFIHNNETISYNKDCKKYNFTIEFNPNKIKDDNILLHILKGFPNWLLRSFDVAMDVPISIRDIIFNIGNRRKTITRAYGGDNLSYSVGEGHGRYKIYNKKRESDLKIVGDLTRIELSFEYDDFPLTDIKYMKIEEYYLPEIYLNQYVTSLSDITHTDKTLNAILFAVQQGFPIKDLSRRYKEKIDKLLEGGSKIRFDKISIQQAFNKCIFAYFISNSLQFFK